MSKNESTIQALPEDIADAFKPLNRWHWIMVPDRGRVFNVALATEGGRVTRLEFEGKADQGEVLSAIIGSQRRKRQRRKKAAARGAETRKRRGVLRNYRIAKSIVEGWFKPSLVCACCRRKLTDRESLKRGVGSECWAEIKQVIEQLAIGREDLKADHK
jgi:hypothetical protein